MREGQKELYKMLEVSKRYPIIGAKMLGVNLPYYQQVMLQTAWTTKYPIFCNSRRTGKTFTSALLLVLKCLLYPQTKCGVVASVFRQAQTVFIEAENLIKQSPFLQSQIIDEPKRGSSEWHIDWKNGSIFSCLPFSDNIRSKGFNVILVDEYAYVDNVEEKMKRIIKPMLFTKNKQEIQGKKQKYNVGNQLIIASTANFKFNPYYKLITEYKQKIKEGNENYAIISFDYRDGLECKGLPTSIFEEEVVLAEYEDADPITRKMEYLNIFPDDSGSFIGYELIQKYCIDKEEVEVDGEYRPKTVVEFEQTLDDDGYPVDKYILTFDDADKNDNFAISLQKLDGSVKRFVRIIAMKNKPIQSKIKIIRDLLRKFNIVLIACDQRNRNIVDNLAEFYYYEDGTIGEPILLEKESDDNDEQLDYVLKKYGKNTDYRRIIRVVNFSANLNEQRARHLLGEIEKGRVKFPAPLSVKSKREEDAHNEFKKTFAEIVSIQPQPRGKYVAYEPPGSRKTFKKDRWTVTELGVWVADEYIKEQSMTDSDDIYIGGWRR